MARKLIQGIFAPTNPQKYVGANLRNITYRSGWEWAFMQEADRNPYITAWSSESIPIPYKNPLTGRWASYIPDFFVVYVDKFGKQHAEIIEVKPLKETPGYVEKDRFGRPKPVSQRLKLTQIINAAKWAAAVQYCRTRGWHFRVATEEQLFAFKKGSS